MKPFSLLTVLRFSAPVLLIALVTGCGGGGGSSDAEAGTNSALFQDAPATTSPLIERIATESQPKSALAVAAGMNLMPLGPVGAYWDYEILDDQGKPTGTGKRTISSVSGSTATLVETDAEGNDTSKMIAGNDGVYIDFSQEDDFPPGVESQIGLVREYALPAYAMGEERKVTRKGEWTEDLDGDGRNEQFSFEYTQIFRGFETLERYGTNHNVAHFSNALRFTLTGSRFGRTAGYLATEEAYLAPDMGPIKFERHTENLDGSVLEPRQTWLITSLQVGAQKLENPISTRVIELPHRAAIYDRSRNAYYASVPASVITNGNRIARIDPQDGSVTYSPAVVQDPTTLALSTDNQYLYVGLEGAAQVVKLRTSDLTEVARVNLGSGDSGARFANMIAVSPTNPDNFAVSMRYKNLSPDHAGVAMFYGNTMAPTITQTHTGSNLIAFAPDGQTLYGLATGGSDKLRTIAVSPSGLTETSVSNTTVYGKDNLEYLDGLLYVGSKVFTTADMMPAGAFMSEFAVCRPMPLQGKAVCTPDSNSTGLTVHDLTTLTKLAVVPLDIGYWSWPDVYTVTPGPAGQVAVSFGNVFKPLPKLILVTHPTLR